MLGYLLINRKVWGLTIGFAAYGYSFYLFLTWLPNYLEQSMHMSILKADRWEARTPGRREPHLDRLPHSTGARRRALPRGSWGFARGDRSIFGRAASRCPFSESAMP